MRLFYDSQKAKEIEDKLIAQFEARQGPRNEVHLSDTCHCEMKTYNRLTGMKPVYTKKAIGYMVVGNAGDLLIQSIYPPEQREYESLDIVSSHMDIFEDLKYPLEVKWSAQKIFKAKDVPVQWQLQLLRYMSKHNSDVGWLVIINLFTRQVTAFKMVVGPDERIDNIMQMLESKKRILYASKTGDVSALIILEKECPTCFYKPTKKRKELGLGNGCSLYVRKKRTQS